MILIILLIYFLNFLSNIYSELAQLAEHLTVNQVVAGSSPAFGAKKSKSKDLDFLYQICKNLIIIRAKRVIILRSKYLCSRANLNYSSLHSHYINCVELYFASLKFSNHPEPKGHSKGVFFVASVVMAKPAHVSDCCDGRSPSPFRGFEPNLTNEFIS